MAMKYNMAYFDFVSMKETKYEFPCMDFGAIGPQTSEEIAIPISYWRAVVFCGCGRSFPLAQPEHVSFGGDLFRMSGSGRSCSRAIICSVRRFTWLITRCQR